VFVQTPPRYQLLTPLRIFSIRPFLLGNSECSSLKERDVA
jgi:hypothetical protein